MSKLAIAGTTGRAIARPVKTLIPMIKDALANGRRAGLPYYIEAGSLLNEVRDSDQVRPGKWSKWLNDNFELSQRTAQDYMKLARDSSDYKKLARDHDDFDEQDTEIIEELGRATGREGIHAALGRRTNKERRDQTRPLFEAIRGVDADHLAEERQTRNEEIQMHRDLAMQLIDLGYRALATRLHPDQRGGSKQAMSRLNTVRAELKDIAATRRFI